MKIYTIEHCPRCGMPVERQFYGSQGDGRNLERMCMFCHSKTLNTIKEPSEIIPLLIKTVKELQDENSALMKIRKYPPEPIKEVKE